MPFPVANKYAHGNETLSLREWSKKTGLSRATLRYRLEAGWSVERAFTEKLTRNMVGRIEYDGKSMGVDQWAKRIGISPSTIRTRLTNKLPLSIVLAKGNVQTLRKREGIEAVPTPAAPAVELEPQAEPVSPVNELLHRPIILSRTAREAVALMEWARARGIEVSLSVQVRVD